MKHKKWYRLTGLILVLVLSLSTWLLAGCQQAEAPADERDAPVVELLYENDSVRAGRIDDFEAFVNSTDKPVFIDFWAAWCGPCRDAAPFVDSLSATFDGSAHILKVNVDEAQEIAAQFGVQSIPLFVLMHQGEVVDYVVGYNQEIEANLKAMIENYTE